MSATEATEKLSGVKRKVPLEDDHKSTQCAKDPKKSRESLSKELCETCLACCLHMDNSYTTNDVMIHLTEPGGKDICEVSWHKKELWAKYYGSLKNFLDTFVNFDFKAPDHTYFDLSLKTSARLPYDDSKDTEEHAQEALSIICKSLEEKSNATEKLQTIVERLAAYDEQVLVPQTERKLDMNFVWFMLGHPTANGGSSWLHLAGPCCTDNLEDDALQHSPYEQNWKHQLTLFLYKLLSSSYGVCTSGPIYNTFECDVDYDDLMNLQIMAESLLEAGRVAKLF